MYQVYTIRGQIYLLVTAMAISAVLILVSAAKGVAHDKSEAAAKQASQAAEEAVGYMLGEYNGKIALFREDSTRPYKVLDMEVYLLAEEDLEALRDGIIVDTEEELLQMLEDWDS